MADARAQTEALLAHVVQATPTTGDVPLGGVWSLVHDLEHLYVQVEDGSVILRTMQDIQNMLRTQPYAAVAVGRCDQTVLWAFVTRRYAAACENEASHHCGTQFCLTTETFLPAVLIAAQVHHVDPAANLRVHLSAYAMTEGKRHLAHMLMCEFAARSATVPRAENIMATEFYVSTDPPFVAGRDLLPFWRPHHITTIQLKDALTPYDMAASRLQCSEQLVDGDGLESAEFDSVLPPLFTAAGDLEHLSFDLPSVGGVPGGMEHGDDSQQDFLFSALFGGGGSPGQLNSLDFSALDGFPVQQPDVLVLPTAQLTAQTLQVPVDVALPLGSGLPPLGPQEPATTENMALVAGPVATELVDQAPVRLDATYSGVSALKKRKVVHY